MKFKVYILLSFLMFAVLFVPAQAGDGSAQVRERKIKAAFLYNFINFIEWPKEKMSENDAPVLIGIVGPKKHAEVYNPIMDKKVKGKDIIVNFFSDFCKKAKNGKRNTSKWDESIEHLKKCHIVFVSNCEIMSKDDLAELLEELKGMSVLTAGEQESFLADGGIINFVKDDKKVRFEINLDAAKKNNLEMRSKLLKLARRVINGKKPREEGK